MKQPEPQSPAKRDFWLDLNGNNNISERWKQAQQENDFCANAQPTQIVPHVFLGSLSDTSLTTLDKLNISHVLSLKALPQFLCSNHSAPLEPNRPPPMPVAQNASCDYVAQVPAPTSLARTGASQATRLIRGKYINIPDSSDAPIQSFFDETREFIDEARKSKQNVLVHCLAGISRSATIVIAYLMATSCHQSSLGACDWLQFVASKRSSVMPNIGFIQQLVEFEKLLSSNHAKIASHNHSHNHSHSHSNSRSLNHSLNHS